MFPFLSVNCCLVYSVAAEACINQRNVSLGKWKWQMLGSKISCWLKMFPVQGNIQSNSTLSVPLIPWGRFKHMFNSFIEINRTQILLIMAIILITSGQILRLSTYKYEGTGRTVKGNWSYTQSLASRQAFDLIMRAIVLNFKIKFLNNLQWCKGRWCSVLSYWCQGFFHDLRFVAKIFKSPMRSHMAYELVIIILERVCGLLPWISLSISGGLQCRVTLHFSELTSAVIQVHVECVEHM